MHGLSGLSMVLGRSGTGVTGLKDCSVFCWVEPALLAGDVIFLRSNQEMAGLESRAS